MMEKESGAGRSLLIIGAGGLGQEVAEMAAMRGEYDRIAFLDDDPTPDKQAQFPVVGCVADMASFAPLFTDALPAFGNNEARARIRAQLAACGFRVPCMIHPTAWVSSRAEIGAGTIIRAHAGVSWGARIGECCLINMGALIDHGCVIGDESHIPMGCVVRGEVQVPPMSSFKPNEVIE